MVVVWNGNVRPETHWSARGTIRTVLYRGKSRPVAFREALYGNSSRGAKCAAKQEISALCSVSTMQRQVNNGKKVCKLVHNDNSENNGCRRIKIKRREAREIAGGGKGGEGEG